MRLRDGHQGFFDEWSTRCIESGEYECQVRAHAIGWADRMEVCLTADPKLEVADVALDALRSLKQETETTGLMHSYAVLVLRKFWVHGDEFYRWHCQTGGITPKELP